MFSSKFCKIIEYIKYCIIEYLLWLFLKTATIFMDPNTKKKSWSKFLLHYLVITQKML